MNPAPPVTRTLLSSQNELPVLISASSILFDAHPRVRSESRSHSYDMRKVQHELPKSEFVTVIFIMRRHPKINSTEEWDCNILVVFHLGLRVICSLESPRK